MPIFFDLDAPQDLIDSLKARSHSFKAALDYVYSEGYKAGFDAGCSPKFHEPVSQWPKPRSFDTDPPTFEDADPHRCISVRVHSGDWIAVPWERAHRTHPGHNLGWARSPQWVPQSKALRTEAESAIEAFDHILKNASTNLGEASVRGALEKLRKLEQEGRSAALTPEMPEVLEFPERQINPKDANADLEVWCWNPEGRSWQLRYAEGYDKYWCRYFGIPVPEVQA